MRLTVNEVGVLNPLGGSIPPRPTRNHLFIRVDGSNQETPNLTILGLSSVSRAPALQVGGQGFDPPSLPEVKTLFSHMGSFVFALWNNSEHIFTLVHLVMQVSNH